LGAKKLLVNITRRLKNKFLFFSLSNTQSVNDEENSIMTEQEINESLELFVICFVI